MSSSGPSSSEKTIEWGKDEWSSQLNKRKILRTDMDKLVMDYLVTEGYKDAAERFQEESGITPPVDLNTLDDRIKIRNAIQNGQIQEAIRLVNQLHPELLDNDRYLYFHLQQLELIELIRNGRVEEALHFAQSQLSESGEADPTVLAELERTMALLAFEDPNSSPFADLLNARHRQKVASEVNTAILKAEYRLESSQPKMYNLVRLICWAQDELMKKKVKFPRLTDPGQATFDDSK